MGTTVGGRFDYVKYDETAIKHQENFKTLAQHMEANIEDLIKSPRAKAVALTKLEEVYMWIGKGIRDDQIKRNGSAELQEERINS